MIKAELKVLGGKHQGKFIPLSTKKFLVGREQDCHLRPSSELVSRHHCVFSVDEYAVRLRDLESTHGTLVNGIQLRGEVILTSGDKIKIGVLEFELLVRKDIASRIDPALPDLTDPLVEAEQPSGEPDSSIIEVLVSAPMASDTPYPSMFPGHLVMPYPVMPPGYPMGYPAMLPPSPAMPLGYSPMGYPPGYPMYYPQMPLGYPAMPLAYPQMVSNPPQSNSQPQNAQYSTQRPDQNRYYLSIAQKLQHNHVHCPDVDLSAIVAELANVRSPFRVFLSQTFHRIVQLNAKEGLGNDGAFSVSQFLEYAARQMALEFGITLDSGEHHPEEISQIIKDEPRSLFVFLEIENIPIEGLLRLRGFTQEQHQSLFCGSNDLDGVRRDTVCWAEAAASMKATPAEIAGKLTELSETSPSLPLSPPPGDLHQGTLAQSLTADGNPSPHPDGGERPAKMPDARGTSAKDILERYMRRRT